MMNLSRTTRLLALLATLAWTPFALAEQALAAGGVDGDNNNAPE